MYRILLADDEQIERMALARRLQREFGDVLEIREATDGREALELFRQEQSQIVIMDISMPEMDGMASAEAIRKLDPECVIIFLTAYDDFAYAKRAIVIRALDYLLKPCEQEELVAVMEEAMRLTDRRLDGGGRAGSGQVPAGQAGSGQVPAGQAGSGQVPAGQAESGQVPAGQTGSGQVLAGQTGSGQPGWNAETVQPGQKLHSQNQSGSDDRAERLDQVAETIRRYIRMNYMNEISMQDAARMMHYSDAYFCKLFKQCFDQNFTTYLTHFRVEEAKRLLRDRTISVKDVSAKVGYYDSNYFAKVFKRITGMIPSEYRSEKLKQEESGK